MRGPGKAPHSTTSRTSGPTPITVSGSMIAVTPASSSLGRLNSVTIAAVVGGRWKNSSSFDCTSSNVMWQWASISPGMIVAPAASMPTAPSGTVSVPAGPTATISSPWITTSTSASGAVPRPSTSVPPRMWIGVTDTSASLTCSRRLFDRCVVRTLATARRPAVDHTARPAPNTTNAVAAAAPTAADAGTSRRLEIAAPATIATPMDSSTAQ